MATILVVEDDKHLRAMLKRTLTRSGHSVVEAGDGEQGLALFRAQPTDIVITDILMPGCDGIETIIGLRRMRPDLKIVAISGGGRVGASSYLEIAQKLGAQFTLRKPFKPADLLAAIGAVSNGPIPAGPPFRP